jgi:hypothetical protein
VTDYTVLFAIAFAIYLVAFAPLGWRLLTESDEAWAGSPAPTRSG